MGIHERREREKEQRRNDILDAAEKVFFSKGLHESTMDDVAETAELSKGTLYLYFKSKEELYLGIHQRGFTKMREMFMEAVAEKKTGLEKLQAVGYAYFNFARKYPDYYQAIMYFEKTILDYSHDDDLIEHYHDDGINIMSFVQELLRSGIKDGSIQENFDIEKMSYILWGQVSGIIQIVAKISRHKAHQLSFDPDDLFEEYMHLCLINFNKFNQEDK